MRLAVESFPATCAAVGLATLNDHVGGRSVVSRRAVHRAALDRRRHGHVRRRRAPRVGRAPAICVSRGRSRSAGALSIGVGLTIIATGISSATAVSFVFDLGAWQGRLSGITVITTLFVALGMHLLVFEDMTDELRLTNRRLAGANEEVQAAGDHRCR